MFEQGHSINKRRYRILSFLGEMVNLPQQTCSIRESTRDKTSWNNVYKNLRLLETYGFVVSERQSIPGVHKEHTTTLWSITQRGKRILNILKPRFREIDKPNTYFMFD